MIVRKVVETSEILGKTASSTSGLDCFTQVSFTEYAISSLLHSCLLSVFLAQISVQSGSVKKKKKKKGGLISSCNSYVTDDVAGTVLHWGSVRLSSAVAVLQHGLCTRFHVYVAVNKTKLLSVQLPFWLATFIFQNLKKFFLVLGGRIKAFQSRLSLKLWDLWICQVIWQGRGVKVSHGIRLLVSWLQ